MPITEEFILSLRKDGNRYDDLMHQVMDILAQFEDEIGEL